jgi:hypothetical protein
MATYLAFFFSQAVLALTRRNDYAAWLLFIVINFWFVGLRFEVGFDWFVYKDQFEYLSRMSTDTFLSEFAFLQQFFRHEAGFLLFAFVGSHAFPTYEIFHLFVFGLFFSSVISLARAIQSRNIFASFLIIHFFLLFTLEFSTLRQLLALSIFNIGLNFFFRNRKILALSLMLSAPFFQLSALIYFFVFLAASGSSLRLWISAIPLALTAAFLSLVGLSQMPGLNTLGPFGAKLIWYFEYREFDQNIFEQAFFLVFYLFMAIWAIYNVRNSRGAGRANLIVAKMILIFAFAALLFFPINVIRNRIMYELIILASLSAFTNQARLTSYLKPVLVGFGIIFLSASLLKSTAFVYVPYQNYLVYKLLNLDSDGAERQERLFKTISDR